MKCKIEDVDFSFLMILVWTQHKSNSLVSSAHLIGDMNI